MKKHEFLSSAAVLSVGGIVARGIGAVYRLPLAALLGSYGMGLYQMAYPLFCVLLTFSSAGIPAAFSRLVARESAQGAGSGGTLKEALKLFSLIGLGGALLMCLFAPHMSALQGERALLGCYFALAPSVFFVALIAVLRGYFQGKSRMAPTALSEIVESGVKAALGLCFARRFSGDPARAVVYCLWAVTLSEIAALVFLLLGAKEERRPALPWRRTTGGEILRAALPVMAATGLLPLSQTADSVLIVRLLSGENAVSLYGLFSGAALSLIDLPATACYGLAAASVPAVSRAFARGEEEEGRYRALFALGVTLLLSLPCSLALFFGAAPISALLYPALGEGERALLVRLIRTMSVSAMTLAGTDTLAACLTGMGRAKAAAGSMALAVAVKFCLQWALVGRLSVVGAAVAANGCYLVAFFLDLIYTVRKQKERKYGYSRKSRDGAGRSDPEGAESARARGRGARAHGRGALGSDPL